MKVIVALILQQTLSDRFDMLISTTFYSLQRPGFIEQRLAEVADRQAADPAISIRPTGDGRLSSKPVNRPHNACVVVGHFTYSMYLCRVEHTSLPR